MASDADGRWTLTEGGQAKLRDIRRDFLQQADDANPGYALAIETDRPDAIPWGRFRLMDIEGDRLHAAPFRIEQDGITYALVAADNIPNGSGWIGRIAKRAVRTLRETGQPDFAALDSGGSWEEWFRLLFALGSDVDPAHTVEPVRAEIMESGDILLNTIWGETDEAAPNSDLAAFQYQSIRMIREDVLNASAALVDALLDMAATNQRPPDPFKRLNVNVENATATLDGNSYPLSPEGAAMLAYLKEAGGGWVGKSAMQPTVGEPKRVRQNLPRQLQAIIEPKQGKGHRLTL